MTSRAEFLIAAEGVLRKAGRPMHYTAITRAAIKLELLQTESVNAEITMSSTLSADISVNPSTKFQRERAGVYSLRARSGDILSSDFLDTDAAQALEDLRKAFPTNTDAAIIRRATYFYGRLFELSRKGETTCLEGGRGKLEIDPRDCDKIRSLAQAHHGVLPASCSTSMSAPFLGNDQVVLKIKQELSHLDWKEIVSLALILLNYASAICASQGRVRIAGSRGATTILVMSEMSA